MEDQQIIDDLRERMKLLGLDPSDVEAIVKRSKAGATVKRPAPEEFPVHPQRALEESRKRTAEQGQRLAKIVLNHVGLSMEGREILYKYRSLGVTGRTNFVAAVMMVNHEINERLGKDRHDCSTEEFQALLDSLEDILQTLVRRLRKAKSEYEKRQA